MYRLLLWTKKWPDYLAHQSRDGEAWGAFPFPQLLSQNKYL